MAQEALRQIATMRGQPGCFGLNYTRKGAEKLTGLVLRYVYPAMCAWGSSLQVEWAWGCRKVVRSQ